MEDLSIGRRFLRFPSIHLRSSTGAVHPSEAVESTALSSIEPSGETSEKGPVACDAPVSPLATCGEPPVLSMNACQPMPIHPQLSQPDDRGGPSVDQATRFNQVHRLLEILLPEKWKPIGYLLIGEEIHPVAAAGLPAIHPETTEVTVAVEKHDGTGKRRKGRGEM